MTYYMSHPMNWYEARRQMARRMMNAAENFERTIPVLLNVSSNDSEYVVKALLPGLKAEDVKVEFTDHLLKIEGELKFARNENEKELFDEFPEGKFTRSIELSEAADSENIQATIADGILTVRVPKVAESKPRTIKINVA
jgi:HSP20 family protein